jgi:hypothetical protein
MKLEAKKRLQLTSAKVDANTVLETLYTSCQDHLRRAGFKLTKGHKYASTNKYAKQLFEVDVSFKGEKTKAVGALKSFLKKNGFTYAVAYGAGRLEKKTPVGLARVEVWGEDSTDMHVGVEVWATKEK